MNWDMPHSAYPWAQEFDTKVKQAIESRDLQSLESPHHWGEALLANAHPTMEHYAPVLYTLGSTNERDNVSYPYEGMEFGSVSMRMVLFQPESSSQ
jgi:4,5-DOPA dioxygenase extradiol